MQRFDFIENQYQPRVAGVLQNQEQPTKKTQGREVIHVALDPGHSFHRCGDMGLPRQPASQAFGGGMVIRSLSPTVGSQGGSELRCCTSDLGQSLFQQLIGPLGKRLLVAGVDGAFGQDVFFQAVEPAIQDRAERTQEAVCRGKLFHRSPVNSLQPMKWGFRLGNLDLGDGEALSSWRIPEPSDRRTSCRSRNRLAQP